MTVARSQVSTVEFEELRQYLWDNQLMDNEMEKESLRQHFIEQIEVIAVGDMLRHEAAERGLFDDPVAEAELNLKTREVIERMAATYFGAVPAGEEVKYESDLVTQEVERRMDEFTLPDRATWRHIYIKYDAYPTREDAQRRADEVSRRLAGGTPLKNLIAEFSDEPDASAEQTFGPMEFEGRVFPAMADTIRGLKEGETSEALQTGFGIFFIQVVEHERGRLWGNEEKRRAKILFELRAKQSEERREKAIQTLRETLDIRMPETKDPAASDDALYLAVEDREFTMGEFRALAQLFPPGVAALAEEDPWSPYVLGPLERQFLLIEGLKQSDYKTDGEVERLEKSTRKNLIARKMMDTLMSERRVEPTEEELTEAYEARLEDFTGDLIDAEAVILPDPVVAALANSNAGYELKQTMNRIRGVWQANDLSAQELADTILSKPEYAAMEEWNRYPVSLMEERYLAVLDEMRIGDVAVVKLPISWAIFRLEGRSEGAAPLESVRSHVRGDLMSRKNRELQATISGELKAKYGYELLARTSQFYWDEEANDLGLMPLEAVSAPQK